MVRAADALGDVTTINPCSLVNITELEDDYTVVVDAPPIISTCSLDLDRSDHKDLSAEIGRPEGYRTATYVGVKRSVKRSGGLRIATLQDTSTACTQLLVFADDITLRVDVTPYDTSPGGLCTVATTLLDQVIKKVTGTGPTHHSYPANSLTRLDACKLLTTSVLSRAAGLRHPDLIHQSLAHDDCKYDDSGVEVTLQFGATKVGQPLDKGATKTVIAGRRSILESDTLAADRSVCVVFAPHTSLAPVGQSDWVEQAAIAVVADRGAPACTQAKQLAAAIWPKLPAA